jgi:AcrR family transcriptional regulator
MRVDASRNYHRLLAVAEQAFGENGVNASLNEIAKRAGVGAGTLYRHFPTREALLQALLHERFEGLGKKAAELSAEPDAGTALVDWLRALIAQVTTFPGLASSMMEILRGGQSELMDSCSSVRDAGAAMLARAQAAGAVRPEVDIADVLRIANAVALVTEWTPPGAAAESDRMLSLIMSGLWAAGTALRPG